MSADLIKFFTTFASYCISMVNTLFRYLNMPIVDIIADSAIGESGVIETLIEWLYEYLPRTTLLQFLTVNIGVIVAVIVLKWFKELID